MMGQRAPIGLRRECVVCRARLQRAAPRGSDAAEVCGDPECVAILRRSQAMGPASRRRFVEDQSQQRTRQREQNHARAARFNAIVEAEAEENEAHRQEILRSFELDRSGAIPLVILPSGPRRECNLPARRLRRYRDHLTRVIGLAVAKDGQDDHVVFRDDEGALLVNEGIPIDPRLQMHACSLCNGGCCPAGREHAFVSVETIRRYREAHPEARPRQILEAYLSHVPNQSCEGSCVNHTSRGCNLPGEMRSDVCGRYLCPPLEALQADLQEHDAGDRAIGISRALDKWSTHRRDAANAIVASGVIGPESLDYHLEPVSGSRKDPRGSCAATEGDGAGEGVDMGVDEEADMKRMGRRGC